MYGHFKIQFPIRHKKEVISGNVQQHWTEPGKGLSWGGKGMGAPVLSLLLTSCGSLGKMPYLSSAQFHLQNGDEAWLSVLLSELSEMAYEKLGTCPAQSTNPPYKVLLPALPMMCVQMCVYDRCKYMRVFVSERRQGWLWDTAHSWLNYSWPQKKKKLL